VSSPSHGVINPDQSLRGHACLQALRRFEERSGLVLPLPARSEGWVTTLSLKPRESAFRAGDTCPYLFVVRSGLLKQHYTTEDGREAVKSFSAEGAFFGCPAALAGRTASFSSTAIEPSVVERIDFRALEALADTQPAWQKALRIGFAALAEIKVGRERDLLTLSAEQLYLQLVRSAPDLVARIPQKDLAGYLGVTAVGLNRIIRRQRPPP
jgi:CRP-like cAMP-binding protein